MRGDSSDPAAPSGGERLVRAARAARDLSETLWECLQEELIATDRLRARELAERLSEVSTTVAVLLDTPSQWPQSGEGASQADRAGRVDAEQREAGLQRDEALQRESMWPHDQTTRGEYQPSGPVEPGSDPLAAVEAERRTPPDPVAPPQPIASPIDEQKPTATVTPLVLRSAPESPHSSGVSRESEIEIRDVRREEGPSAWISLVGRMLARYGEDQLPFAVLLVEIVDVAQLERSETPHDLHGLVAQVESALGRGMRVTDELSRETLGRYWLLAPETNGTGARMLAERLARLVRSSASHRGVPMEVAIGIAVCPDDGVEAPALAARADLGVYSARATGRSVARTEPPG